MNDWQAFLVSLGGQLDSGIITAFSESPADYARLDDTISDLSDLGVLSVVGPDARKFLHGQATCDFLGLAAGGATRGAVCNPKGRMITSFLACLPNDEQVLLVMDRELVGPTIQAIAKYAAFFKAELSDQSAHYRLFGLRGKRAQEKLSTHFPAPQAIPGATTDGLENTLVVSDANLYIVVAQNLNAETLWRQLANQFRPTGLLWWRLQMIRAGLPSITPALSEQFVPQMLNLQAIGGVSFSKGCYTGQEVVARMQYLGKLKRRTYLLQAHTATIPDPGAQITLVGNDKSVGTVLQAAPADPSRIALLAILREAALTQMQLVCDGTTLSVEHLELPYEIAAR